MLLVYTLSQSFLLSSFWGPFHSMSGFTSGSIKQAIKFASNKIILFFGPEDISKLVIEAHSFDEMLNMKYKAFVTKNEIEYSLILVPNPCSTSPPGISGVF